MAVEPKGKRRVVKVTKHRKIPDFAKFVKKLATKTYKHAKKIILVVRDTPYSLITIKNMEKIIESNPTNTSKFLTSYELLTLAGQLIKAIDACTDWFLLSRLQRDTEKREIYSAIYEAKCRTYRRVLEEVHGKLNG